jgi:hypothetical protein
LAEEKYKGKPLVVKGRVIKVEPEVPNSFFRYNFWLKPEKEEPSPMWTVRAQCSSLSSKNLRKVYAAIQPNQKVEIMCNEGVAIGQDGFILLSAGQLMDVSD